VKTYSKRRKLGDKCWGKTDLYYTSKDNVLGSASLKTSHFAGLVGNREASPVRKKSTSPYLMYIYYKFINIKETKATK
jgi:hypothetical protein